MHALHIPARHAVDLAAVIATCRALAALCGCREAADRSAPVTTRATEPGNLLAGVPGPQAEAMVLGPAETATLQDAEALPTSLPERVREQVKAVGEFRGLAKRAFPGSEGYAQPPVNPKEAVRDELQSSAEAFLCEAMTPARAAWEVYELPPPRQPKPGLIPQRYSARVSTEADLVAGDGRAISLRGYSDEQILAEVAALRW